MENSLTKHTSTHKYNEDEHKQFYDMYDLDLLLLAKKSFLFFSI